MKLLLQSIPKIKVRVALKPLADMIREIGAIALLAMVLLFISDRYFTKEGGDLGYVECALWAISYELK